MPQSITVVIPCYGQARFIGRAIESCLSQVRCPDQIVVVDDGSPDDVGAAVRPYEHAVTLVRQANRGLSAARSAGLARAEGTLVKFLDADDWLLPESLEVPASLLDAGHPRLFVATGYRIQVDGEGEGEDYVPGFGSLEAALCWQNPAPVHAYLFPTRLLRGVGGFDDTAATRGGHEDYELLTRLALAGAECVVWPRVGCVYWRNPAGMSRASAPMDRTRLSVWSAYARQLLSRWPSATLQASLLGGLAKMIQMRQARFEGLPILERLAEALLDPATRLNSRVRAQIGVFAATAAMFLPDAEGPAEGADRGRMQGALSRICAAYPIEPSIAGIGDLRREFPLMFAVSALQHEVKAAGRRVERAERRAEAVQRRAREARAARIQTCLPDELALRVIESGAKTVAIFGTGSVARRLLSLLRQLQVDVALFLDSRESAWGQTLDGVPVKPPAAALEGAVDVVVIGSLTHGDAMERALAEAGNRLGLQPRLIRPSARPGGDRS